MQANCSQNESGLKVLNAWFYNTPILQYSNDEGTKPMEFILHQELNSI
jgi:hypothetical protein